MLLTVKQQAGVHRVAESRPIPFHTVIARAKLDGSPSACPAKLHRTWSATLCFVSSQIFASRWSSVWSAGGIGFYIQLYARAFQHEKVATLTVVLLQMVVLIEQLSTRCRRLR